MSETDAIRAEQAGRLNHEGIPTDYDGPTWDTTEMQQDFEVRGFMAPYVVVRRRSDNKLGSLMFTHAPRLYFGWREDGV